MKTRIMLDLETLGTAPGSAILAIGAVKFGNGVCYAEFYQRVDLQGCIDAGLRMDPSTVLWWLQQPDEARLEITKPGIPLAQALQLFSAWVHLQPHGDEKQNDVEVWGNGAAFDNALLDVAYTAARLPRPWRYSNDRCYRTVKNIYLGAAEMQRTGTHHNALDDARSQAMYLMQMIPAL